MAEAQSCRQLYLTQIQYLEEQLESLPLHCEKMNNEKKQLMAKRDATEKNMKDKIDHLKNSVATEEKIVTDLFAKLEALRIPTQEAENDRVEFNKMKLQMIEENKQLQEENAKQSKILEDLQEQLTELNKKLEVQDLTNQLAAQTERHQTEAANLEAKFKSARERILANLQAEMERAIERKPSIILENERALHTSCLKWIYDMESDVSLSRQKDDLVQREEAMEQKHKRLVKEFNRMMMQKTRLNKGLQMLWRGLQEQITATRKAKEAKEKKVSYKKPTLKPEDARTLREARLLIKKMDLMKEHVRINELKKEKRNAGIILRYIMRLHKYDDPEYKWMCQRLMEILQSCAEPAVKEGEEREAPPSNPPACPSC